MPGTLHRVQENYINNQTLLNINRLITDNLLHQPVTILNICHSSQSLSPSMAAGKEYKIVLAGAFGSGRTTFASQLVQAKRDRKKNP